MLTPSALVPRAARAFLGFILVGGFAAVAVSPATGAAPKPADNAVTAPTFMRGVNISHWLSQNYEQRPYAAKWFDEEDVRWIAGQGFDHLRIPVDGREWLKRDGSLDEKKIAPFDKALRHARAAGLGVILDMHFLPGASFDPTSQDATVFTDEATQKKTENLWRLIAKRFAAEDHFLRFEILNEPVAKENAQLNTFNRRMLAAIRESNPTRTVYITSNRWSSFTTVKDLEVPADPNVAITVHFYEPMPFTHQRASWVEFSDKMPPVTFPGTVPDMTKWAPAGHWVQPQSGKALTVEEIDRAFADVATWAAAHAAGREIHVGEFGVYKTADDASADRWTRALVNACARHGWGWAVWDYQGGFAIRDESGKGTRILKSLPLAPAAKR